MKNNIINEIFNSLSHFTLVYFSKWWNKECIYWFRTY